MHRSIRRAIFVGLALIFAAADVAHPDPFDQLREEIPQRLADEGVPSLAVAVARDAEILWEQGFGWADREKRMAADEHTLYSLASISKPITATGLMVLVERGMLNLDSPANNYLGEARLNARLGDAGGATLRRLADHTSGLPLHYHFFYADEPYRRPPMDETIRRYGNLVNPPGETFRYSNLGFGVLDYVISRTSGQSYSDFMRQQVFLPLGLVRMSVDIGPGLEPYAAVRYASDQTPLPFYEFDHPGGSAVWASAHDLVRFGMFHLKQCQPDQRAILADASIDQMQQPTAEAGNGVGYGVGWFIDPDEHGVRSVGHSGGMGGVRTRLVLAPEERIAVAVLCNASSDLPMQIAQDILAALLPQYAQRLAESRNQPAGSENPPALQPDEALRGTWKGAVQTYARPLPIELVIKDTGDIHVRLDSQLWTLLNEPKFEAGYLTGVFAGDIGTDDAHGRPYHLHLHVKLRDGGRLNGSLAAISLPAPKPGNALSHWIELTKQAEPAAAASP